MFAVALIGGVGVIWGEHTRINEGLGWDGAFYGDVVQHFAQRIRGREINSYGVQRILPSALVWSVLTAFGAAMTPLAIVRAFLVLNVTLLVVGAWMVAL